MRAALLCGSSSTLPAVPTRAQVCGVRTSFQGLTVNVPGYGSIPWFDVFYGSLDAHARQIVTRAKKSAGDTHLLLALSYNYANDNGFSYPIPGADYTQNLPGFRALVVEALQSFTSVCIYLAGDGQTYAPDGGTYGYPWLMANLPRIMDGLRDLVPYVSFCHGFELISNGAWSPDDFESAVLATRALIPNGYIASHIGTYTWWGDKAGTSGGPIADWSGPAGQAIDICFEEGDAPFVDANGNPTNDGFSDGWQQRAHAHIQDAKNIEPRNRVVFEWPIGTPRGPRYPIALELDAFRWTRERVSVGEIDRERNYLRSIGFEYVC